jgi:DNA-directed RNA polymerase specialized sigma24 family protein
MKAGDDPRLSAFLRAASDDAAESALAALFDAATERTLIEAIRRAFVGSARQDADADDVASETRLRLIRRLWTLRREGGTIDDFAAYVATTATRTCYAHLRSRFPARTRFRNQVRYSVSRHPGLTLEESHGVWQCRSHSVRAAAARGAMQQFIDAPSAFLTRARIDPSMPLPHLIAAVLTRLEAPIELDRLVDALCLALGVADARPAFESDDADTRAVDRIPDPFPGTLRELADREALLAVWDEVADLPANQRAALLLNLRDPDGGAALHALPATGLVTMSTLAQVLDLSEEALTELWHLLPLDDLAIGVRLGITRQQVINLRKSARARLARRTDRDAQVTW